MIQEQVVFHTQKKANHANTFLDAFAEKNATTKPLTNAQKGLVAQLVPKSSDSNVIDQVIIAGRPERLFGNSMGDHTTAFSVHAEGIKMHLRGKTYKQAAQWFKLIVAGTRDLPGIKLADKMSETSAHNIKLKEAYNRLCVLLLDVERADPNSYEEISSLQELVSAYLSYRELIPLSAVNVMSKSQGTAGKGHGEAKHVQCLVNYELEIMDEMTDEQELKDAILGTFDPGGVALAVLEQDEYILQLLAPGVSIDTIIKDRFQLYINQHLQSIKSLYPKAYEAAQFDPKCLESLIKSRLLEAAHKDFSFYEKRISSLNDEITRIKQNAHNPNKLNKRDREDVEKRITELKLYERSLKLLKATGLLSEEIVDKKIEEVEEKIGEPISKRRRVNPKEDVEENLEEQEEEKLLQEELKQTMAIQLIVSGEKISELRSAGRTPSPFIGTMGAHTTAWVVHLDRIRAAVENKTIDEAVKGLLGVSVELKASYENLKEYFKFDSDTHEQNFQKSYERINKKFEDLQRLQGQKKLEKVLLMQACITDILTYANYIPGATIQAVDTGGKSEGKYREVLRNYDPAIHSIFDVGNAINALLDVSSLTFSNNEKGIKALRKNHEEVIEKAYPKAHAAYKESTTFKAPVFSMGISSLPAKARSKYRRRR